MRQRLLQRSDCSWESTVSTAIPGNCGSVTSLPIYPAGLTTLDTTYKAPGAAMWSLGVQHELKPSVIAVSSVRGQSWVHQNIDRNINTFPIDTPDNLRALVGFPLGCRAATYPAGSNELRTYPGYGGISQEENTTNNTYNGLQTSLRLQNRWGVSGELDYTYSHTIDLTDGDLATIDNAVLPEVSEGEWQL